MLGEIAIVVCFWEKCYIKSMNNRWINMWIFYHWKISQFKLITWSIRKTISSASQVHPLLGWKKNFSPFHPFFLSFSAVRNGTHASARSLRNPIGRFATIPHDRTQFLRPPASSSHLHALRCFNRCSTSVPRRSSN